MAKKKEQPAKSQYKNNGATRNCGISKQLLIAIVAIFVALIIFMQTVFIQILLHNVDDLEQRIRDIEKMQRVCIQNQDTAIVGPQRDFYNPSVSFDITIVNGDLKKDPDDL